VEAYWKSVQMPGEGVFVGDPLARPWGSKTTFKDGKLTIKTSTLMPTKKYTLRGKDPKSGKWVDVKAGISVSKYQVYELVISPIKHAAYELVEVM